MGRRRFGFIGICAGGRWRHGKGRGASLEGRAKDGSLRASPILRQRRPQSEFSDHTGLAVAADTATELSAVLSRNCAAAQAITSSSNILRKYRN